MKRPRIRLSWLLGLVVVSAAFLAGMRHAERRMNTRLRPWQNPTRTIVVLAGDGQPPGIHTAYSYDVTRPDQFKVYWEHVGRLHLKGASYRLE